MNPKISIIIPCYNVQAYIQECLDSVLNQNFSGLEIICVEDCGTDGTLDILKSYPDIKLIEHAVNQGPGAARNTGIANASGDYISFLDGDDLLTENALNTLYQLAIETGADITSGQIQLFDEIGDREIYFNYKGVNGLYTFDEQKQMILGQCYDSASSRLYKRDYFTQFIGPYPVDVLYEDVLPYLKGQVLASKLAATQAVCVKYRQRAGSIMHSKVNLNDIGVYLDAVYRLLKTRFADQHREYFLCFLANNYNWFPESTSLSELFVAKLTEYAYTQAEITKSPRLRSLRRIRGEKVSLMDKIRIKRNVYLFN